MSRTVKVQGQGQITIKDSDFLSSGGEAEVYLKKGVAYKIYHNPDKVISERKFKELSPLAGMDNIVVPEKMVYDSHNTPIGFSMTFKPDTEPLCKLFTNSFKKNNNVSTESISSLVERMQETIKFIHDKEILVVDLNELNLLVPNSFSDVYFIDVDSYQTKSHRATAIMTSIKDPLVQNNHWTDVSDWFSFAVLAFQMWIGIHPYKGRHPDYKPKEWLQRMEDGVSVFDGKSRLPRACNDFSIIPPSHYEWLKAVFTQNERSEPPKIGDLSALLISSVNIIQASNDFETELTYTALQDIRELFDVLGVKYFAGDDGVYKESAKLSIDVTGVRKTLFATTTAATPVVALLKHGEVEFNGINNEHIESMYADDIMSRNGNIYSVSEGKLYEHSFNVRGNRYVHNFRFVCSVMANSVRMYDGVLFQQMFKKQHAIIPYESKRCSIVHLEELDGSRVVEAACEKNVCVVLCEKNGVYNRHVFTFESDFINYIHRISEDVVYAEVNFTVLPNGVTILATNDEVEIFKGNGVKVIDDPPFNASTKLFNKLGTVYYIDGKEIHRATIKK
jgi:hypothetical protein